MNGQDAARVREVIERNRALLERLRAERPERERRIREIDRRFAYFLGYLRGLIDRG